MRRVLKVFLCLLLLPACEQPFTHHRPTASSSPDVPAQVAVRAPVVTPSPEKIEFTLANEGAGVRVETNGEGYLARSTSGITSPRDTHHPITMIPITAKSMLDTHVADNTSYTYLHIVGERVAGALTITRPNKPLPLIARPSLLVDKIHYYLEVRDGGQPAKRYPFVLGSTPKKRKLNQDNQSTPEGFYRIINLQPEATYHKAYDIDYPNTIDRFRYRFAQTYLNLGDPGIGGEIQIHGWGIPRNYTWGCMALRDTDMDELFEHPEIAVNTSVKIVGHELSRADLVSIGKRRTNKEIKAIQKRLKGLGFDPGPVDGQLGEATRTALGRFQIDQGLAVSCQLDEATVQKLDL